MIGSKIPRGSALVLLLAAGCGDDTPEGICSSADLEAALDQAQEGDAVEVGACEVEGSFTVPAGVTLRGTGSSSALRAPAGGVGATLEPGAAEATRLVDLRVVSDGPAAVVARDAGRVALESVEIEATSGIGVGAVDLDSFVVSGLTITGSRDATYGLVIARVASVALTDVSVDGFAATGALLVDSGTPGEACSWHGGEITHNIGSGLMVAGGVVDLQDLTISENLRGDLVRTYGALFGDGAAITSSGLVVRGNEGIGLVQYGGATAQHQDLIASENDSAGVWMQECDGMTIGGADSMIDGNGFAGVVTVESQNPHISDATIQNTATLTEDFGDGPVESGDGFQFVRSTGVELRDLRSQFNERIQGLFNQGGPDEVPTGLVIEGVVVDGTESQLGCLDQNGDYPGPWDAGMERLHGLGDRDEAFELTGETLSVAGIIGPSQLPALPDLAALGL